MKNKFICIHGHFYQPPRENPWTGKVEVEASAQPFHDWNERIFKECYEPNSASPILDAEGKVRKLIDNYEFISFNFGPTLLQWLERKHPEAYKKIIESDRKSVQNRSGHGNALAQVYNHLIMPLAIRRDKETEVRWGIADFERRFSRKPEGLWLSETAVDDETLEVLITENIKFTILAPKQASRVRIISAPHTLSKEEGKNEGWTNVTESTLDTTHPYRWFSKEAAGKYIDLFFYNGPIAQALSFERLLNSGDHFAKRLLDACRPDDSTQLIHAATDGENYGHHHRFGNMALSYALELLQNEPGVTATNYGQFLSQNPPAFEAEIVPRTAWSCAHGIGRWMDDCGCSTGVHPDWNQRWRRPLRDALDWLSNKIDPFYIGLIKKGDSESWTMRDAYIRTILERGTAPPRKSDRPIEMEHQRLLMYTSCGWFFDDISGIEPIQILKYAARSIDLARSLGHPEGANLEQDFLDRLSRAPSNNPKYKDGADVFRRLVDPLRQGDHHGYQKTAS